MSKVRDKKPVDEKLTWAVEQRAIVLQKELMKGETIAESAQRSWDVLFNAGVAYARSYKVTRRDMVPGVVAAMGAMFRLSMKERTALDERIWIAAGKSNPD